MDSWFESFLSSQEYTFLQQRPIAYFCAEIALTEDSPTYAGGLGILASDMVREAADKNIPLIAVSLYYHEGYLHHELYSEGTILKHPAIKTPEELGFKHVMNTEKQQLIVSIPLSGRQVNITAWEFQMKNGVRIFLLDTDLANNDPADRNITNRLYVSDKETRFKQEMVLGIGGFRLLKALDINPGIYHLNEGHSALLTLEVTHHEMNRNKKECSDSIVDTKKHIVFTNHTLVAAGNDMFNKEMVAALLTDYSKEIQIPVNTLVSIGLIPESSIFSMTNLALRMAGKINGVSQLHADKANEIWPGYSAIPITNGIHIPSWNKINDENAIWEEHQENKRELLQLIQKKTGILWGENELLFGWARRMVRYKRPLALFEDEERLFGLLNNKDTPIRIVISGSAHESDLDGASILDELQALIGSEFKGSVVYLPNYNLGLAKVLTAGCDVWLNTPVIGFEACGTSGMKAGLNGVLPCSTKDGWMNEVDLNGIGWVLNNENITASLLDTIEEKIIPLYYKRDVQNVPSQWIGNMKKSREMIVKQYSASRMLREYISSLYMHILEMIHMN